MTLSSTVSDLSPIVACACSQTPFLGDDKFLFLARSRARTENPTNGARAIDPIVRYL